MREMSSAGWDRTHASRDPKYYTHIKYVYYNTKSDISAPFHFPCYHISQRFEMVVNESEFDIIFK